MKFLTWQTRRRHLLALSTFMCLAIGPGGAGAQDSGAFPSRPVTIVVPFAAGGGTDIVARLVGAELALRWKTSVIVENRPGAGGQIGNVAVARAKPDGYTLLLGITTLIQAPALYKSLPYDVFNDFTPLAQLATSTNFLVVPASSPANSLKEFVALAKASHGKFSFGSNGNAGSSHLHGALLNATNQLGMVHVPYSGSGPLLTALLGQQVECAFVDIAPLRAHIAGGKLKILAGTGTARLPLLPAVPTLGESGIPGFEPIGWFALFGPAGLPDPVRKTISGAVVDVLQMPTVVKRIDELGLTPAQISPEVFAGRMKEDQPKWTKMVQVGNVTVE